MSLITERSYPESDKIRHMFSQVAKRYDLANTVLSLGIHHVWRRKLVKWSGVQKGQSVLDCATGTGDLALEFKNAVGPSGKVIGTDFCPEMLESAPIKAKKLNLDIQFEVGDVTDLKFKQKEFDISSISFGIRNVNNPRKGISEMARVTRSGGYVLILEFGQVNVPLLSWIYKKYSTKVLPLIGGILTGQRDAYKYLQKSSASFPCKKEFCDLMLSTGSFSEVEYKSLSFGIAYIYRGKVKQNSNYP